MWFYAFGSSVRGELTEYSDIDILVIGEKQDMERLPKWAQTYSIEEVKSIFSSGDLFAHHLSLESALIYSKDGSDLIGSLGAPAQYSQWKSDFDKFVEVIRFALEVVSANPASVFHKGLIYMCCRDLAMIYSHTAMQRSNFSAYSPYHISINPGFQRDAYEQWRLCRVSSTRGLTPPHEVESVCRSNLQHVDDWLDSLIQWRSKDD